MYVKLAKQLKKEPTRSELEKVVSERQVRKHFGNLANLREIAFNNYPELKKITAIKVPRPNVLLFDIETKPIKAWVWDIWNQNIGLNQIIEDWSVLSWSAKWLDSDKIMYQDNRKANPVSDDKEILYGIRDLLDKADIVITQNGIRFDQPKLFARFKKHGIPLPSTFKHIDTCKIAKKYFAFTSNKLEHLCEVLGVKKKKLKHKKFPGFEMWDECIKGNLEAWQEMELYNKHDVLALEEVFWKLQDIDSTINFDLYHDEEEQICRCGSTDFTLLPKFYFTPAGKFHLYRCNQCNAVTRDTENLFTKEKKKSLRRGTVR